MSFTDRSFVIANSQPNSIHIIFCSDGFCKMTGYTRAEVIGNLMFHFKIDFPFILVNRLCNEMR